MIFHEHIMGNPTLAREKGAPGEKVDILGKQVPYERVEDVLDELEDLYSVIEELKHKQGEGMPEGLSPMKKQLMQQPVPHLFGAAMAGPDASQ